jgi:hypothetical protein
MSTSTPHISTLASACYAVLRHMGSSAEAARAELDLPPATADRYERLFQGRPGRGPDSMRPRFARHDAHVRAALGEGGFAALKDFCR